MRFAALGLFFFVWGWMTASAQDPHAIDVTHYRDSVDRVFADPEQSILSDADLEAFTGLPYYAYDPAFRVPARFTSAEGETFQMKTTTSRLPEYRAVGFLSFTIDAVPCTLQVYQNIELSKKEGYEDYLFIPFTDLTNGDETYGGGRYLDIRSGDLESDFHLDFNRCYNPYCVYSKKYSCPIPPSENHLNVAIKAGVKDFVSH